MPLYRLTIITSIIFALSACSEQAVEEVTFRKVLQYNLVDLCGDDKTCVKSVKAQIKPCMESSNWKQYLANDEDAAEAERFINEFYSCLKDDDGKPLFGSPEQSE